MKTENTIHICKGERKTTKKTKYRDVIICKGGVLTIKYKRVAPKIYISNLLLIEGTLKLKSI